MYGCVVRVLIIGISEKYKLEICNTCCKAMPVMMIYDWLLSPDIPLAVYTHMHIHAYECMHVYVCMHAACTYAFALYNRSVRWSSG